MSILSRYQEQLINISEGINESYDSDVDLAMQNFIKDNNGQDIEKTEDGYSFILGTEVNEEMDEYEDEEDVEEIEGEEDEEADEEDMEEGYNDPYLPDDLDALESDGDRVFIERKGDKIVCHSGNLADVDEIWQIDEFLDLYINEVNEMLGDNEQAISELIIDLQDFVNLFVAGEDPEMMKADPGLLRDLSDRLDRVIGLSRTQPELSELNALANQLMSELRQSSLKKVSDYLANMQKMLAEVGSVSEEFIGEALKDKDKKVIAAFYDKKPMTGVLLETDGKTLFKGNRDIAHWTKADTIKITMIDAVRSDDEIMRYLKKYIPSDLWDKSTNPNLYAGKKIDTSRHRFGESMSEGQNFSGVKRKLPDSKFKLGDIVKVSDLKNESGKVERVQYDDHLETFKYKVNNKFWNEKSLEKV